MSRSGRLQLLIVGRPTTAADPFRSFRAPARNARSAPRSRRSMRRSPSRRHAAGLPQFAVERMLRAPKLLAESPAQSPVAARPRGNCCSATRNTRVESAVFCCCGARCDFLNRSTIPRRISGRARDAQSVPPLHPLVRRIDRAVPATRRGWHVQTTARVAQGWTQSAQLRRRKCKAP